MFNDRKKIREAKYNKRYRRFMEESRVPSYLEKSKLRKEKKGEKSFNETKMWEYGTGQALVREGRKEMHLLRGGDE